MSEEPVIKPDQQLLLRPRSQFYPGPYQTQILVVNETEAVLQAPYDQGKLVLLSVNTLIEVTDPTSNIRFEARVLARNFQDKPTITISIPPRLLAARTARVVTITSGKGGVGKTSLVINLAIALARQNLRVFVLDADLGTANIDVLLNLHPHYNISHVAAGQKDILDIVVEAPGGFHLVPGGSGLQSLADLEGGQLQWIVQSYQQLEAYADLVLIDTGAGLSKNVINFVLAADQVIVVTTAEPHAITDAYGVIKTISQHQPRPRCTMVINRVDSVAEGRQVSQRITSVSRRFLDIDIETLGYIPDDPTVTKAIKRQTPHLLAFPQAPAAREALAIANQLWQPAALPGTSPDKEERSFFVRVKNLLSRSMSKPG